MLIDKMLQGTIRDKLTEAIESRGEGILDDEGVDQEVAHEIAEECLDIVMVSLAGAGYYVIEGLDIELVRRFGIEKVVLPVELLEIVHADVQSLLESDMDNIYRDAISNIPSGRLANMFPYATTNLFWDCECKEDYIHPKDKPVCKECGCKAEDMPDSMLREAIRQELI